MSFTFTLWVAKITGLHIIQKSGVHIRKEYLCFTERGLTEHNLEENDLEEDSVDRWLKCQGIVQRNLDLSISAMYPVNYMSIN